MKKIIFCIVLFFSFNVSRSQILMSLLFGDKLNSPNIEFGLEGGANFSTISNLEGSNYRTDFNLGFYLDFNLKNPSWIFNTGLIVKSTMGAKGLAVYSLDNTELDAVFSEGSVKRKMQYFSMPLMIKYKFDFNIYVKAGTQIGFLSRAYDEFSQNYNGEEATYKNNLHDEIYTVDAGLALGLGYQLKVGHGINLGLQYYYGVVPLQKGDTSPNQYNRSLYITAGLPIGKGKATEKKALEAHSTLPKS